MFYAPLHEKFPEVAEAETRALIVLQEDEQGIPIDTYYFIELFCNDKKCDCRRVFFDVFSESKKQSMAIICWGWETGAFYQKWLGDSDKEILAELKGPSLNSGSYQSSIAPALLKYVTEVLIKDTAYTDRIQRHYNLLKKKPQLKFH